MESPFNLSTLTLSKSSAKITIFANGTIPIKMNEYPASSKVLGFIQNDMGIVFQDNPKYEGTSICKTELEMMKKYYDMYCRPEDKFIVAHSLSKIKWGRTNPVNHLSLSVMHRPTRHALCQNIYVDKDMVNAHVSIICGAFKHHPHIDVSALAEYNSNPKLWRQRIAIHHGLDPIIHKDIAKQLFIRILFGGTYEEWIKDFDIETAIKPEERHPLILSMENQLIPVMDKFYNANPHMVQDIIKSNRRKFEHNVPQVKRSLLGYALQTIERWIMEDCIQFIIDNRNIKISDTVPCQDGFMFKKEFNYPECEADLNRYILEKYGLDIKWVDKEFDEAMSIPNGIIEHDVDYWTELITDVGLAKQTIAIHGNKIQYKRSVGEMRDYLYVFNTNKNRWLSDDPKTAFSIMELITSIKDPIIKMIRNDTSLKHSEVETYVSKVIKHLSTTSQLRSVITQVLLLAKWDDIPFDSNPYYLGFENGYIDLRTTQFKPYDETVFITKTTGYNYSRPDYNDEQTVQDKEELASLFEGMFKNTEDTLYYLQVMASGLDGINYQYIWFFEGAGGNGKTMGINLNRMIIGDLFCKSANPSILTVENDKGNQASENLIILQGGRTIVFEEFDRGEGMTWSCLKLLTGGNKMTARRLYKGLEEFSLEASIICTFNSRPEMVGHIVGEERAALERRLKPIHFPFIFTENEDKIASGGSYKRANAKYVNPEWMMRVRHIYLDLLLGIYYNYYNEKIGRIEFAEPESIRFACQEYLSSEDVFQEIFTDLYVECDSQVRLYLGDVFDRIKTHDVYKVGCEGKGRKAFQRTWNKKSFLKWCKGRFDIKFDSCKSRDYINGWCSVNTLIDCGPPLPDNDGEDGDV